MDKTGPNNALTKAPSPPRYLNDLERKAWKRLWRVLIPLGKIGPSDVLAVENTARIMAKLDAAYLDPTFRISTLVALVRVVKEQYRELGLSPATRDSVGQLERVKEDDMYSEFDP